MTNLSIKQISNLLDQKLKNFAIKEDLKNLATKDDLKNFATKSDLTQLDKKINRIEGRIDKLESNLERQIKGATEGLKDFIETMFASKKDIENIEKRVDKLEEEFQTS